MKNASSLAALTLATAVGGTTLGYSYSLHAAPVVPAAARLTVAITNHPTLAPNSKAEK